MPMTSSDLEGHISCRNLSDSRVFGDVARVDHTICLQMNQKAYVACTRHFNCFRRTEWHRQYRV